MLFYLNLIFFEGDKSRHVIGQSTPEKEKAEVETTNVDPDFEK